MTLRRSVSHVSDGDGNSRASRPQERYQSRRSYGTGFVANAGTSSWQDGGGEGGFAMVNVTNGS